MAKNTKHDFCFYSVNGGLKHRERMTEQDAYNFAACKGFLGRYSVAKVPQVKAKSSTQRKRKPNSKLGNTAKKGKSRTVKK